MKEMKPEWQTGGDELWPEPGKDIARRMVK
jgi:hypothetical protein